MPRPPRRRRICRMPCVDAFCPRDCPNGEPVLMTLDEYEALRLVDLENRTHEQCAAQMDISRSTVQEICESARRKVASCLVYGKPLVIAGGSYRVCDGRELLQCGRCCGGTVPVRTVPTENESGGESKMRIAVTYDNGQVFQHFGHTEQLKLYDVADGKVVHSEVVDTNGSGHGALAGFLIQHGVDVLICGGIGGGAQMALAQVGVRLYGGVQGDADAAVNALLAGNLDYNPDVRCNHHDHEHGEGGHTCGDHGCGQHGCH